MTFFVAFVAFEARREQKYLNELVMPVATDNDITKHPQVGSDTEACCVKGCSHISLFAVFARLCAF